MSDLNLKQLCFFNRIFTILNKTKMTNLTFFQICKYVWGKFNIDIEHKLNIPTGFFQLQLDVNVVCKFTC